MARFIADGIENKKAWFAEDALHMSRILRMQAGDALTVLYEGMAYDGRIESIGPQRAEASLANPRPAQGEADIRVVIYQGMTKGPRMEYTVQKSVELGAAAIVPVWMERCEAKPGGENKGQRLQKIAREAAKQSGRGLIPKVEEPIGLKDIPQHDLLLCPYEKAEGKLTEALGGQAKSIGIVIGPEGGLTENEAKLLADKGGRLVTLGPRILRAETAGPAALAAIMAILGEWDRPAEGFEP